MGASRRPWGRQPAVAAAVALLAAALAGCGEGTPDARPEPGPSAAPAEEGSALWLSFDQPGWTYDGGRGFPDALGRPFVGRVLSASGGEVSIIEGPAERGRAVRFPPPCDRAPDCPRALVEVDYTRGLNPGARDFAWGATVQVDAEQTSEASNIVQKGRFGSEGGQWKLQVDSVEGNPSCVVRDTGSGSLAVYSPVSIADGAWHTVRCEKTEAGLTITVDGDAHAKEGRVGSVETRQKIRVGASGLAEDDDRFLGAVDDVFLWIDG